MPSSAEVKDFNNLKLLTNKRFKEVIDYFKNNGGMFPKDIDFIRLYFNLNEMKIITTYSHNGAKKE